MSGIFHIGLSMVHDVVAPSLHEVGEFFIWILIVWLIARSVLNAVLIIHREVSQRKKRAGQKSHTEVRLAYEGRMIIGIERGKS